MSNRRIAIGGGLASLVIAVSTSFAQSDCCPGKCCMAPMTLVVPFPPGGSADMVARTLGQSLQQRLGQTVVIENKPGGSGLAAAQAVAGNPKAMLVVTSGMLAASSAVKGAPDFAKDFLPVTRVAEQPLVLVVPTQSPVKSVKDLVDEAKRNPGKLSFGSPGTATLSHFAGEGLAQAASMQWTHVPYKGAGPAMTDVIAGNINAAFLDVTAAKSQIEAGRLRPLAVTSTRRVDTLPQVPTLDEQGIKIELSNWVGIMLPKGASSATAKNLHADVAASMTSEVKSRLREQGVTPTMQDPAAFAETLKGESARFERLTKERGIKLD